MCIRDRSQPDKHVLVESQHQLWHSNSPFIIRSRALLEAVSLARIVAGVIERHTVWKFVGLHLLLKYIPNEPERVLPVVVLYDALQPRKFILAKRDRRSINAVSYTHLRA